jgi:hypothetical protein
MDHVVGGSSGDGDISAWALDVEGGSGGECLVDELLRFVLVPKDFTNVVWADMEVGQDGFVEVVESLHGGTGEGDEYEEEDDTAADAAPRGRKTFGMGVVVEDPLKDEDETGDDEDERPPLGEPLFNAVAGDAAELDEKKDDAKSDKDEGTDDGPATSGSGLEAEGFTLGTEGGLLGNALGFELGAVKASLLAWVETGRWWVGGHDRMVSFR